MIEMITEAGSAMWTGVIVMGAVILVPPLVWLIGLTLALRNSTPGDRADILLAYATLRLPTAKVGRVEPGGYDRHKLDGNRGERVQGD